MCSGDMVILQFCPHFGDRSKKAAVAPWNNAARTAVGQDGGPSDYNLQANHQTDHLRQHHAWIKAFTFGEYIVVLVLGCKLVILSLHKMAA